MAVLEAARRNGLLTEEAARVLKRGYLFLRRLESRLRIVRDRSAERLPASPEALSLVARRFGLRRRGGRSAGEQLLAEYLEQTGAIRRAYEEIVHRG
jgi:glutamate-ammonia-ligase adenylyltransferase